MSRAEITRYSRHLLLPDLGEDGQRRLRAARVLVVGAGGLGSPVLLYLAAAGVGTLGVVDADEVELSNLQRQIIHGEGDVGRAKVDSAADAVARLDPAVRVIAHHLRLDESTVDEVLAGYDLVIDGTDNFPTRYLVNDACVRLGLPEVWGSIYRMDAQVAVFWGRPPESSGVAGVELRDLFPSPPAPGTVPSCAEGGVLGAMCGQVGALMATEAVKLITGVGEPLLGRVLVLDALAARWTELSLVATARAGDDAATARRPADAHPADAQPADAQPANCGLSPAGAAEGAQSAPAGGVAGAAGAVDASAVGSAGPAAVPTVTARELGRRLDDVLLVDVREPGERLIASIDGAVHVPLAAILDGSGLSVIPRERPVVLHCRSGVRSEQAARALLAAGYDDVVHLAGGILAWATDQDPSMATY
ncbi:molybdopterin biosynthesis-like protein MoeZ [Actinotalea ferrariae CF5-4]|uniref:Molybdopterin biosynthesis-like protein MoeZ n=1 Tax=Actinotalea ferrariae CF5-4 TaxID=948458 RepID=A0A021VTA9_9CELL|nr:molybdopterin biosynthesis-like protein MoeZ [Actinotalea ferrariae CF5-4]